MHTDDARYDQDRLAVILRVPTQFYITVTCTLASRMKAVLYRVGNQATLCHEYGQVCERRDHHCSYIVMCRLARYSSTNRHSYAQGHPPAAEPLLYGML